MPKRVMQQTWRATIGKAAIIGIIYTFSLAALLILTVLVSVVFI